MSRLRPLVALLLAISSASLGVLVTDLGPEDAAASGIANLKGAAVREVVAGGAAERAGIRQGDIITAVGSDGVASAAGLIAILARRKAGDVVVLGIVRPGRTRPYPRLSIRVTLGDGATAATSPAAPLAGNRGTPDRSTAVPGALRTVGAGSPGAVAMTAKQGGTCKAFAPADWSVVGSRPQNDAVDLTSGDRRLYAGWGIRGVNRSMQQYYGDLYGDPETSSRFVVRAVGQSLGDGGPFNYAGAPQDIGSGFVVRQLESRGHRALVVYRTYPAPMGFPAGSYIISARIAMVPRDASARELNLAIGVAASINCATTFIPPKTGDVPLPRPGDVFDRKRRAESDDLDYNVQLGTQYAHTPSGDLYYLDRATMWNETGPDGPGYYRKNGNDLIKLIPGVP